jgi:DNA invertase Pin-like site-specific DNA recombinase
MSDTDKQIFKKVALYARVSKGNGVQDPQMQLRDLREYCKNRGWKITAEYVDKITGSKERRPQLERLTQDCKQRKIDAVVIWKLDRFARSLKHLVNALAEFESLGIAFVSFRDNLDLTTPAGRLMFQVIGAMAEFERSLIQERVKAGLRNAKAKGVQLGRPRARAEADDVRAKLGVGATMVQAAAALGVSESTAYRLLRATKAS